MVIDKVQNSQLMKHDFMLYDLFGFRDLTGRNQIELEKRKELENAVSDIPMLGSVLKCRFPCPLMIYIKSVIYINITRAGCNHVVHPHWIICICISDNMYNICFLTERVGRAGEWETHGSKDMIFVDSTCPNFILSQVLLKIFVVFNWI